MRETQGALTMLLRRYRLILGKCRLRNALAGLLLGAVLLAPTVGAADSGGKTGKPGYLEDRYYTGTVDGGNGAYAVENGHVVISNEALSFGGKTYYGGHADGTGDVTGNTVEMKGEKSRANGIRGGFTEKGKASGNRVILDGGKVGDGYTYTVVRGGSTEEGQASDNHVEVKNADIGGAYVNVDVNAGYSAKGDVSGNRLEISNVTVDGLMCTFAAGYAAQGNSTGNTLVVTGGDMARVLAYGGYSRDGALLAADNTVTFTDARVQELTAGFSTKGEVRRNSLTFGGTSTAEALTGGYSPDGNVYDNTAIMNGGTVSRYVIGGDSMNGLSTGNTAEIHGGTVKKHVYGGYSTTGTAEKNTLRADGGTIEGNAYGSFISDKSDKDTAGSTVSFGGTASVQYLVGGFSAKGATLDNDVTVSGGTVHKNLLGGESISGEARGNRVTVTGGTLGTSETNGFVYGGYSESGAATGNTVNITDGTLRGGVMGGYTSTAEARDNKVTVSGGIIGTAEDTGFVYGGQSEKGSATGNTVSITGGTLRGGVMGGYVDSGAGAVTGNTVLFSGGTVTTEGLYGGYSDSGDASGNTVHISGGTPGAEVYGGYVWQGAGKAVNNTVILEGAPDLGGTTLYGGGTGSGSGDVRGGNTLEVRTSGLTAVNVGNFETYRFILPEKTAAGATVLTLTDNKGTDISKSSVEVGIAGGSPLLRTGDSVTLLANEHGLKADDLEQKKLTARQGVFLNYDFTLKPTDTALVATVSDDDGQSRGGDGPSGGGSGARLAPQAKSPLEGVLGNVALGNMGADLVAGQGMDQARTAAGKDNGSAWGITPFAAVTGTSSRYQTGSHMDLSGVAFMTGFAKRVDTSVMDVLAGVFFEAGFGRVNTHNSFDDGSSVDGEGRNSYYGGGLLARLDLKQDLLKGLYLEGSFRYGRINSQWETDDLHDAVSGRKADYDLSTPYYGLHAGLGYLWDLTDSLTLDLYGKYFWTHTDGQSTHIVNDPWSFDDVDSQRLRLGARLSYAFSEQVSGYTGAAWEHEFNGKARATTYGLDAPSPSLTGDSALLEAGLTLTPVAGSGLSLDFGVQGHTGVRQGISGTAQVRYEF